MLSGLIKFTLLLMGKFQSKVEQIESRTASWNGLCSTSEGPLYSVLSHCNNGCTNAPPCYVTRTVHRLPCCANLNVILTLCLP
jgi:hypothetical protein